MGTKPWDCRVAIGRRDSPVRGCHAPDGKAEPGTGVSEGIGPGEAPSVIAHPERQPSEIFFGGFSFD